MTLNYIRYKLRTNTKQKNHKPLFFKCLWFRQAEKEGTLSRKIQYSFNPYIQVNILLNPIQSID